METGLGPLLYLLSKLFRDEEVVYGALIGQQVLSDWTRAKVQVVVGLEDVSVSMSGSHGLGADL